jgi:2,4-dichlorophenol 6-monooxygenase
VLAGRAGDRLLDTYEAERRPGDARNVRCSLENGMNHFRVAQAIGLVRPDRFVAWRSLGEAADPRGELARALAQVLDDAGHRAIDRESAAALFAEET